MLQLLGARVLAAHDGDEGLRQTATGRPDLVLCDLRMPRMDGFEYLRELTRLEGAEHPPVVALSGLVSAADRQRTKMAGFDAHLSKPFNATALVSTVQGALGRRRVS